MEDYFSSSKRENCLYSEIGFQFLFSLEKFTCICQFGHGISSTVGYKKQDILAKNRHTANEIIIFCEKKCQYLTFKNHPNNSDIFQEYVLM